MLVEAINVVVGAPLTVVAVAIAAMAVAVTDAAVAAGPGSRWAVLLWARCHPRPGIPFSFGVCNYILSSVLW